MAKPRAAQNKVRVADTRMGPIEPPNIQERKCFSLENP
jgi:hypothetical protein